MEGNDRYVRTPDGVRLFVQTAGSGGSPVIIPNAVYMFDDFKRLADDHLVISFDLRNRGRSETVEDPAQLSRGVEHDADDIEAVRRHFGLETAALVGHSYLGLVVALYAMRYPGRASRVIQIGAPSPFFGRQYPAELCCADDVMAQVSAELASLQKQRQSFEPVEFCRKWWSVARRMFVADERHLEQVRDWGYCELPNERNFMKHMVENIVPSFQGLDFKPEDFARVTCPVLTIHGRKDRNAPYGAGVDWTERLPNARLLTVEDAAHVPWVEDPEKVWSAIRSFLNGTPVVE
jgi:proline iminopeptidase